ncbi:hypothetical protein PIB30_057933 [Stylosanthes scabra]|uniref:Uncharacterized protein n=1 Tax=Stylosanthes scabra TaxID=79078 RepID=A0ABU6ULV7_9FABA|nr:hypothetical protein [Stylosanthes scabra]
MESVRWAQWAMLRSATIMKFMEPRLTLADQWEGRCAKLTRDLKLLNQQKVEVEKKKLEADQAKSRAEEDLKSASANFKLLEKEIEDLRKPFSREKVRADKAEASLVESKEGRQELIKMAGDFVTATENALKAQILLLLPDFDVSQLGAFGTYGWARRALFIRVGLYFEYGIWLSYL